MLYSVINYNNLIIIGFINHMISNYYQDLIADRSISKISHIKYLRMLVKPIEVANK